MWIIYSFCINSLILKVNYPREGSNLTLDEILSSLTCLQLKLL